VLNPQWHTREERIAITAIIVGVVRWVLHGVMRIHAGRPDDITAFLGFFAAVSHPKLLIDRFSQNKAGER